MPKKTIFLSHASVDGEVAGEFKRRVESDFLNLLELFVSSQLDSINAGRVWYDSIISNLNNSVMMIGLVSPVALQRGWVYFEFGAAVIQKKSAIPVCHSGILPGQLPEPISHLQAISLADQHHLRHLYGKIAGELECAQPDIDYGEVANQFYEISETHRVARFLSNWHNLLTRWNPGFNEIFSDATSEIEIQVPQHADVEFSQFIELCNEKRYLEIKRHGMGMGTSVGAIATIAKARQGDRFSEYRNIVIPE